MVCSRKHLVVFGGFHDNLRDYKYFNDVYAFDLENYVWKKIVPTGAALASQLSVFVLYVERYLYPNFTYLLCR